MKRKTLYWIVGVVLVLCTLIAIAIGCGDAILTHTIDSQLKSRLEKLDSVRICYGDLDVRLGAGIIRLEDVEFCSEKTDSLAADKLGVAAKIKKVEVGHINLLRTLRTGLLSLDYVAVEKPQVVLHTSKQKPVKVQDEAIKDSIEAHRALAREKLAGYLSEVTIAEVICEDACISVKNIDTRMSVKVDNVSASVECMGYKIADATLYYADSLYTLSAKDLSFVSSNGLFGIELKELHTAYAGAVVLEGVHLHHRVKKTELGKASGKVPVTWADVHLTQVRLSPLNIVRQAMNHCVCIDTLSLKGKDALIFRDLRYVPKKLYGMPQEGLMKVPIPMSVKTLHADLHEFTTEVQLKYGGVGTLQMQHIGLAASNLSNEQKAVAKLQVKCKMAGGNADIRMTMTNDKACHFGVQAHMTDLKVNDFGKFLRPMLGMSAVGNIHDVKTSFKGDRKRATGELCVLYDGMKVELHKEEIPMERLRKNAGLINTFAPTVIYKSNPRGKNKEPYVAQISYNRNPKKNFASYLSMTMTDGLIHSMSQESIYKMIQNKMSEAQK